ncbi:amidohydrolase family protein, partial [Candidatus Bathyarchaeota archaeon]|nr:amidohydrolase family protein [Candidatus Bathyarchaeota archaeon]
GQGQAVSVMEAIRAYTYNGAYAAFDENKLGSIEAGKLADLIILNDDILSVQNEKIMGLEVIRTIMDGITVYKK